MSSTTTSQHETPTRHEIEPDAAVARELGAHMQLFAELEGTARAYYVDKAMNNLENTSRTARGIVDTSASEGKADQMLVESGDEAATLAKRNFANVIGGLYDNRHHEFTSLAEVRGFVEQISTRINRGITKPGELYRASDSEKYGYTPVAELNQAMDEFANELYERLSTDYDPIELSGWVEYRVDGTDHFFADGCGKTSRALAAWVLMRADADLPQFRGREELYSHTPVSVRGRDTAQDRAEYDRWMTYYGTLFAGRGAGDDRE